MIRSIPLILSATLMGTGLLLARPPAPAERAPSQRAQSVAVLQTIPLCGHGRRITCVVDGDTFWLRGEKIRIANIDAPETEGRCDFERETARRATLRLAELLSRHPLSLEREGTDRHGRTLARVRTESADVGERLVGERLARPWAGRMEVWCA